MRVLNLNKNIYIIQSIIIYFKVTQDSMLTGDLNAHSGSGTSTLMVTTLIYKIINNSNHITLNTDTKHHIPANMIT